MLWTNSGTRQVWQLSAWQKWYETTYKTEAEESRWIICRFSVKLCWGGFTRWPFSFIHYTGWYYSSLIHVGLLWSFPLLYTSSLQKIIRSTTGHLWLKSRKRNEVGTLPVPRASSAPPPVSSSFLVCLDSFLLTPLHLLLHLFPGSRGKKSPHLGNSNIQTCHSFWAAVAFINCMILHCFFWCLAQLWVWLLALWILLGYIWWLCYSEWI